MNKDNIALRNITNIIIIIPVSTSYLQIITDSFAIEWLQYLMTNALLATEQAGQLDTILPIPTIETIVVDRIKITFIDTGDVGAVSICTLIKVHNLTQILFEH